MRNVFETSAMLRVSGHVESLSMKNGRLGIGPRSALVAPSLIFELSGCSSEDKARLYRRELCGSALSSRALWGGC